MNYKQLVAEIAPHVTELFPWDVREAQQNGVEYLLLDIRCPSEFQVMHIDGSLNVPRGILEMAADFGYEESEPDLINARNKHILVICRSGNRSILACHTLQLLDFKHVYSLKTGLRGWHEYEQPLIFANGNPVPAETADNYFIPQISREQLGKG
ncbi:MAG: rhodanese-like domain-containing protein [Gammaproteobacteria bacterium]|nr:rhodanese-like domain-containing protein [Gammaproteobacteria bacterium]